MNFLSAILSALPSDLNIVDGIVFLIFVYVIVLLIKKL